MCELNAKENTELQVFELHVSV